MLRAERTPNVLVYLKLDLSQKSQWDISCLVMFPQKNPATCLLTYRTQDTADTGKRYMCFWQGSKSCERCGGLVTSSFLTAPKLSALQFPDPCFDREEPSPMVTPSVPFRAKQDSWDFVSICCTAATGDCSGNKNQSGTPYSTGKESTEWFKILTSIWLLGSEPVCGWMQSQGKESMLINTAASKCKERKTRILVLIFVINSYSLLEITNVLEI